MHNNLVEYHIELDDDWTLNVYWKGNYMAKREKLYLTKPNTGREIFAVGFGMGVLLDGIQKNLEEAGIPYVDRPERNVLLVAGGNGDYRYEIEPSVEEL